MSTGITISLVQAPVIKGDVSANLATHLAMIALSAENGADLVVFPELSLTGYELELASSLAMKPHCVEIEQLSKAATQHKATVIAGLPLHRATNQKPTIAAAICLPNGGIELYSKQYLHSGEAAYCAEGDEDYLLEINGQRISLAICADFATPEHSKNAKRLNADLYVVSALISKQGLAADAQILSDIAKQNGYPVLLCNHISETGGWQACGNNSVWNAKGQLVFSSDCLEPCLVICSFDEADIKAEQVAVSERKAQASI